MPPREPKAGQDRPTDEQELLGGDTSMQAESTSNDDLRRRIAELEAELAISKSSEQKAQDALAEAQAAAQNTVFSTAVEAVWAGKREDGEDMWKYRIDLSPSGGVEIRLNGVPYYHGEVYTFDTATLRTVQDIVARTWDHERAVFGNNENVYRREMNVTLSGKGGRR